MIKYYGHSAFELHVDGYKILIDPWISNPLSQEKAAQVKDVDLIIVTHGHGDHVGDVATIARNNPRARIVAIYELAEHLGRLIGDPARAVGGNIGGPMKIEGVSLKIALTPAVHSSPYGAPTGVVIAGRELTFYHAGDTSVMMDMKLIGEIYRPQIAMLPIGGHFTMDPVEAAKAVELLSPRVVVPMHYATFPVLYGRPEELEALVKQRGLPVKVRAMRPGEVADPRDML
ncbi:MAG: metal-dependent hydrolase [Acidilobaceae archaeon]|nr:metal-dependent hydrolase [Acidilobaceae archaeon]MDW7973911.1 metal-dependent hydrolase [Sulfolobales archaeon]